MGTKTVLKAWVMACLASASGWAQAPEEPPAAEPKAEAPAPKADETAAPPEAPPPKPKRKTPPPEAAAPEGGGDATSAPPPVTERPKRRRADAGTPAEGDVATLPAPEHLPRHRMDAGAGVETVPLAMAFAPHTDEEDARTAARTFFANLILGDARELVLSSCALPFYVEDRRFTSSEELLQEWLKNLRDKRTDLLTLYGIELLTPPEMEKKYGKPPARLSQFPWKAARTYIAVANLSGHAAVAVVQAQATHGWRVVAFHD
jgi:hypothetical protein